MVKKKQYRDLIEFTEERKKAYPELAEVYQRWLACWVELSRMIEAMNGVKNDQEKYNS